MAKVLIRSLDDYQRQAVATDVSKGTDSPSFILLGLFGEAGSVLSEIKKRERDNLRAAAYIDRIVEELGDLLWYIAAAAARNSILLSEIGAQIAVSHKKIILRQDHDLGFPDIQSDRKVINVKPTLLLEWNLISLAEGVGKLVSDHRTFLKKRDRSMLIDSFATVLNEMIAVANRVGISLETAALENLRKTQKRWPRIRRLRPYFDADFPLYEQIPRHLEVTIQEQKTPGGGYFVHQICNGLNIGDRLTDNISDPDDYRFHDVFHYAYAAVLGWSPVIRSLYKLKRKSDRTIDECQAGARATLIEEGISAIVFNEAKKNRLFADVKRGKLSFDLLKTIQTFVDGYEVDKLPYWAWEDAILQGYEAFRFIQRHRGGRILINKRKLKVGPL